MVEEEAAKRGYVGFHHAVHRSNNLKHIDAKP
jgi:hypothetical protein